MLFKVIGNLKHDGTDYKKDDTIDLEVKVGMALVEDRILEIIENQPESNFHPDADDEPEEKAQVKPKKEAKKGKAKKK